MKVFNSVTVVDNERLDEDWFKKYNLAYAPTTKIGTFTDFSDMKSAIGDFV
jgi:hypothetical protein